MTSPALAGSSCQPRPISHSALFVPPGRPRPLARRLAIHNRVVRRIRSFLEENRFQEVPLPALSPGLDQLDAMITRGFPAVWCEGESTRGNRAPDDRHLRSFKLIEAVGCGLDLGALCDLQETLLKTVAADLSADLLGGRQVTRLDRTVTLRHPRLTYAEALCILAGRGWTLADGQALPPAVEETLIRHCDNLPVMVTHWPVRLKPHLAVAPQGTRAAAVSVKYLLPYAGETMDGGVRPGEPQRAGFGLGVARLLQFLMGLGSITDAAILTATGGCGSGPGE